MQIGHTGIGSDHTGDEAITAGSAPALAPDIAVQNFPSLMMALDVALVLGENI